MEFRFCFLKYLPLLWIVLTSISVEAEVPNNVQALDALLQDYAHRALSRPRTGLIYNASVPANLDGVTLSVVRLRSGSLWSRGVHLFEFQLPRRVRVHPYVRRLALIYQNLGNWSAHYYGLPGYTFVSPVLGLLAYDASNLTATDLPELGFTAEKNPISISFTGLTIPNGLRAKCVHFDLNGTVEYSDLSSLGTCSSAKQGHFSVVVSISPSPSPSPSLSPSPSPSLVASKVPPLPAQHTQSSKVWKITVGSVLGGFAAMSAVCFCMILLLRLRRKSKLSAMERQADEGEALRVSDIGSIKAQTAIGTRTQPVLENEYVA